MGMIGIGMTWTSVQVARAWSRSCMAWEWTTSDIPRNIRNTDSEPTRKSQSNQINKWFTLIHSLISLRRFFQALYSLFCSSFSDAPVTHLRVSKEKTKPAKEFRRPVGKAFCMDICEHEASWSFQFCPTNQLASQKCPANPNAFKSFNTKSTVFRFGSCNIMQPCLTVHLGCSSSDPSLKLHHTWTSLANHIYHLGQGKIHTEWLSLSESRVSELRTRWSGYSEHLFNRLKDETSCNHMKKYTIIYNTILDYICQFKYTSILSISIIFDFVNPYYIITGRAAVLDSPPEWRFQNFAQLLGLQIEGGIT